jgi:hypothetical protein
LPYGDDRPGGSRRRRADSDVESASSIRVAKVRRTFLFFSISIKKVTEAVAKRIILAGNGISAIPCPENSFCFCLRVFVRTAGGLGSIASRRNQSFLSTCEELFRV